ncbi:UDP-N-acetylenolpyruvoylglucosamine reductase [Cellvibrio zantedeschiae]|uniref:UDP-N-acetylenolpyruvoylglucosamine reductase n=1 Tax=Cellvibrio zantedeschiae TaxID=1237077 RepID=A0ABQ3B1V7_9GAMM|nr:UDP-N-acetylmuramate dehydrogenase [Cellvibrio zantedeschiae]GGY71407.1 UDP-N-acetylenolpyruvoylglucosamine reductase [Cellvibrio zantedeschiae]
MPLYLPHFNLQNYNTLASPVCAEFFVAVKDEAELLAALKFAKEKNLPLLVLGGGSNIVLHDDFAGLVIHVQFLGKELVREDENFYYVKAAAGENWSDFVDYCLDEHFYGLENLSLIPGNVGAAPIQNIGAYSVELQDVFSELTALDVKSGLAITFTHEACQFGYRDSVFKNALLDQFIITSVTFKLTKKPNLKIHYPALQSALADENEQDITPELVSQVVCDIRRSKLPDPKQIPNVGSFFKNPVVSLEKLAELQQKYPEIVYYPVDTHQAKLAAGWLIDRAGWKGYVLEAAVHAKQALVLTNPSRLKGSAVLVLAELIKTSVTKEFGVDLEQEPRNYP